MHQRNNRLKQHLSYGFATINAKQLSRLLKTMCGNIVAIELVGIATNREDTKKLKAEYERIIISETKNNFVNATICIGVKNISAAFTARLLEAYPEIIIIYFFNSSIELVKIEQNGNEQIKNNSDCIVELMLDEHVMIFSFDDRIYSADQITDIIKREGL